MIKIKAKFDKNTNDFNIKYTCKNTFTAEALCTIEFICQEILDNEKDMTMKKIFELVKEIQKSKEVK